MTTRSALSVVLVSAASLAVAPALADSPDNAQIERQVDQITKGREYDWLRPPRISAEGAERESARIGNERGGGRRYDIEEQSNCDYEPQPPRVPRSKRPQSSPWFGDCGAEPTAGGESGGTDAIGSDSDCGFSHSSCDCDRPGLGGFPRGCGCGGIGVVMTPTGYLIGAALLVLLIFMVARMILRQDQRPVPDTAQFDEELSPGDVRLSQVLDFSTDQLMAKANGAARVGDFKQAVGWAYLCGINMLHRAGYTDLGISTTNRQIIDNTRRRSGPYGKAARLVRIFEDLFFGAKEPLRQKWEECKRIVEVDFELEEENTN